MEKEQATKRKSKRVLESQKPRRKQSAVVKNSNKSNEVRTCMLSLHMAT